MPVSIVCEPVTANVSAVLRESLGNGYSNNGSNGRGSICKSSGGGVDGSGNFIAAADDDDGCLQAKLAVTAKRVLMSKIEYDEVTNYGQSVLGTLKSKYELLKSTATNNKPTNYDYHSNGKCSSEKFDSTATGNTLLTNNNASNANASTSKRNNPNELPHPKRILYPRENVNIGWKNSVRKWQVGVGMMNVGNTCYLNSTLQALFHVPSLANWLISDAKHADECELSDNCIICAMIKTLEASQNNQSAIRPYLVYSKLKFICKHLLMGRQEDAHEFLRYLVEAMEKSYLARYRNYKELDQYSKETTPLNQILGGYLKSSVRCLACGHVSVTFQHFQDLLLDIRKADTIEEALEVYFSRERLEDMGYKCESCKKKVSATKQFSLERAPIVLCIQLKRFSVMGTKLNKQITIKPRIDLAKFATRKDNEQLTYRLVAMVTHLGASQHCGHYTAIGLTESGTYYNYDDSYVRPVSVQNVCNTNAYIIFYEIDKAQQRTITASSSAAMCNINDAIKENAQKSNGYMKTENIFPTDISNANSNMQQQQQRYDANLLGGVIKPSLSHNNSNINNKSPLSANNGGVTNKFSAASRQIHFKNQIANSITLKLNAPTATAATAAAKSSSTSTSSSMNAENKFITQRTFEESSNPIMTAANENGQTSYGCREMSSYKRPAINAENDKKLALSNNENRFFAATEVKRNKLSDGVSSPHKSNSTLPSMPSLFDGSNSQSPQTAQTAKYMPTLPPAVTSNSPMKSLVPYESETDDESTASEIRESLLCSDEMINKRKKDLKGAVKRPLDSSPSRNSVTEEVCGHLNNNKAEHFIDSAKSINNYEKFNTNNKSDEINTNRFKLNKQQQQHKIDIFAERDNFNANDRQQQLIYNKSERCDEQAAATTIASDVTRPHFQRSHSTPPSPPVIKTKTGLWQVTTLQPVTACVSPPEEKKICKNPKNPFAKKTPELFNKQRQHKINNMNNNTEGKYDWPNFVGNGYRCSNTDDNLVSGLMKQSHRGYGAPVLSWKGDQAKLSKEVEQDAQQQRQNDWQDEEDAEMDRGRQKKLKNLKDSQTDNRIPGYNPFQEEDNQRRWRMGGGGGMGNRHYNGYARNQFQRNKFKFQRFNQKFQRMTAVSYMRNNHRLNQNYSRRTL